MRRAGLRQASYPLDWITGPTFEKRVELLLNHFSGFLELENLQITGRNEFHASVKDSQLGITLVHDFEFGVPLESAFPLVKEKYNRRIARLYRDVAEKPKVLFVWFGQYSEVSPQRLLQGLETLSGFFGKEIYLIAFQNAKDQKEPICEKLSPYLLRYVLDFQTKRHRMGDKKLFHRILRKIAFRGKWKNKLRQSLSRIMLGAIPIKSLRDTRRIRSLWGR